MSNNSITLGALRYSARQQLQALPGGTNLDADLIIMHGLGITKAYLFAHPEQLINAQQLTLIHALIARRLQGEPIAYCLGYQGFWTFDLTVTPDVLIPRPETECLIAWCLQQFNNNSRLNVADLGTGSGAIAIALALERPYWTIHATDASTPALNIAKTNAQQLHASNIEFAQGDWCSALGNSVFDLILSNPPYIDKTSPDWQRQPLAFEPESALFATQHGLADLTKIIQEVPNYLKPGGWLAVEHGYDQQKQVQKLFANRDFLSIVTHQDLAGHPRFTTGKFV